MTVGRSGTTGKSGRGILAVPGHARAGSESSFACAAAPAPRSQDVARKELTVAELAELLIEKPKDVPLPEGVKPLVMPKLRKQRKNPPLPPAKRRLTRYALQKARYEFDYIDQLHEVYPVQELPPVHVPDEEWAQILHYKKHGTDQELVWLVVERLKQGKRFPIDDKRVGTFMENPQQIYYARRAVRSLAKQVRGLKTERLYEELTRPPADSRVMRDQFSKYLRKLGASEGWAVCTPEEFENRDQEVAILDGDDNFLRDYAREHFGFTGTKGIDLVMRVGNQYLVGEAKFLSRDGGSQNNQLKDALFVGEHKYPTNVFGLAIADGVYLMNDGGKYRQMIQDTDADVISALQIKDVVNMRLQKQGFRAAEPDSPYMDTVDEPVSA